MKHTTTTNSTLVAAPRRGLRIALGTALAAGALAIPAGAGVAGAEDPGIDCSEWDASRFTAEVDRLNASMVRVSFTYDDADQPLDVCPYTIFFDLRDGDGDQVWTSWVSADLVASETESVVGAFRYLMPYEGCDWEVRVAVEESLPIVLDSTDVCLDDLGFHIEPLIPTPTPLPTWLAPIDTTPIEKPLIEKPPIDTTPIEKPLIEKTPARGFFAR